ncbi:unnamed protein product [Rotaria sp. Silwood2]|nr:unnamed protein product [Rotaria sp. Silwood2]
MESAAFVNMFKRSVSKYGIYYTKYIGDGDSKTFPVLSKVTAYPGFWTIFWHKYSTNDDPRPDLCNTGWCGYLKSVRDETPYDHTPHALPQAGRVLHQNDNDDETNHSNNALNDDYDESIDSNGQPNNDNNKTNSGSQTTLEHNNITSESDERTTDDNDTTSSNDE